jgi:hypothetical protein
MDESINEQSIIRNKGMYAASGVAPKDGDFDATGLMNDHVHDRNEIDIEESEIKDQNNDDHRKNFIMADDTDEQEQMLPKTNNF